jgi:hypothetical protein
MVKAAIRDSPGVRPFQGILSAYRDSAPKQWVAALTPYEPLLTGE